METKANTALIGAFTLIVLALGFVFIYWLARGSEQGASTPLKIVFQDPVTGLAVGSQVLFNGIKVGDVRSLNLDPENPRVVIAQLSVQPLRSIKADTQVTMEFQGLTGVGYVQMAGGSPTSPPIWESMPDPTITAIRSSMQDLMAGARTILARTDKAIQTVEGLVEANSDDITQAVHDVRTFTGALAQNSDNVADLIEKVSAASAGIADATKRLQGIVERSEALVAAIDPDVVRSTLADVSTATRNLAAQSGRLEAIAGRAETIMTDVQGFSTHLPALGEKADALAAAIDPAALAATLEKINGIVAAVDPETVARTLASVDAVAAAVDPAQVRASVENIAKTTATFAARSEEIGAIVTRAAAITENVDSFSRSLPALGEKAGELAAAIDPKTLGDAVDKIGAVAAAVDPERVRVTVEGVSSLAETLQANRENIDTTLTKLTSLSTDLSAFAARLPTMGDRADALFAAVDPEKVTKSIDDVNKFTATLAGTSDDIDAIVADARSVSTRFKTLADRSDSLLKKLDGLAGQGTGGILEDARATLAAIRTAADSFNTQITAVGGGLGNFSDRGLRDFQNLVSEGQRTISRLDRVISDLEQNPSGFIFGGPSVPEYGGRRR